MTQQDVYVFLASYRYGVLASIGPSGEPQSALVGIALNPALEIVFDTVRSTRKYRNLLARPRCSFVIGSGEQTLQYEGVAAELTGDALVPYQTIYLAALPDGLERMAWPDIAYFVVRPRWIRFSDYAESPPLIEEFSFQESSGAALPS